MYDLCVSELVCMCDTEQRSVPKCIFVCSKIINCMT